MLQACRRIRALLDRRVHSARQKKNRKEQYMETAKDLVAWVRLMEYSDALRRENLELKEAIGVQEEEGSFEVPTGRKNFVN